MRLILLGLLLAISPVAQPATVSGDVRDPSGALLPGAAVTLTSPVTPAMTTHTDARGRFTFADLPASTYELSVSLPGFKSTKNRVLLTADQSVATTIQMPIGSLSEVITVTAVKPANVSVGASVGEISAARAPDSPEPPVIGPALPPPVTADGALPIGGNLRAPRKIRDVKPVYPAGARESGIQGTVILEAMIATDGSVQDARVIRGITGLDQAAIDAVREWRFTPTLLNGTPVAVNMAVSVTFGLN